MRVYLDTEFTSLSQDASLLSVALVDDDNRTFYAEFYNQRSTPLDEWQLENVLPNMLWLKSNASPQAPFQHDSLTTYAYHDSDVIAKAIADWLSPYTRVELWADCPAYDWVLFCQLFGGSLYLPPPLTYIINDFATLLTCMGIDPLTSREELLIPGTKPEGALHNALYDAQCLRLNVQQLLGTLPKPIH